MHKQLECHGFVCQTSEDAIVVAATLYKSLMAHMKLKEMRPKNRNGVTCMSIASSIFNEKSGSSVPVRPPRKKRSTTSSIASDGEGLEVSVFCPDHNQVFKTYNSLLLRTFSASIVQHIESFPLFDSLSVYPLKFYHISIISYR